MYDNVCKFLAETYSSDFAQWLLGEPINLSRVEPSELQSEPIRADTLILLESQDTLLHLEFQTRPDPEIPFRMADYRLRIHRRCPGKQVEQFVIYLKPTGSELARQTVFTIPGVRHEFRVIRLWEIPAEELLKFSGLLPLAALGQTQDPEKILGQVRAKIADLAENEQGNVAAATSVLAGLSLNKALIQKMLKEEVVQDSVIYQEIISKGRAEGRAVVRNESLAQCRSEG
ncbi:MAG: Rpn family recombination-promoting nuclease/putative transposase, partial [Microcoleaceae cyanobacterium]